MLKGMKTMIERLKCCIYILFAKQYALYTADKIKEIFKDSKAE